jgi:hypothetical protein
MKGLFLQTHLKWIDARLCILQAIRFVDSVHERSLVSTVRMPKVGSAAPQRLRMQSRIWITLLSDIVDPDPNSVESFRNIGDYLKRHRRLMGDEAGDMRNGPKSVFAGRRCEDRACAYLLAASNCHRSRAFRDQKLGI